MTRRDFAASVLGLLLSLCAITAQAQPVGLDAFSLTSSPVRLREVHQVVQPCIMPRPIMLFAPDRVSDLISATASTYVRASTAVRPDGVLLPANYAPYGAGGYVLLEGSATSYYCQPYSTTGGVLVTEAPITRAVTLPATGSYVLWCKGGAGLSVNVAAGTAAGTGWGTITSGGYIALNITTAGTVTVTPTGAAAGDQVQLTTGIFPTSFIPTPTSAAVTRASAGSDTSGNGLSIPLSRAMRDSLTGELSDWTAAWSHVSGTAPTYSGGNKILTYSAQTSSDYHVLLPAGVSVGDEIEVNYSISGLTGGTFQLGFGSGATGMVRNADGSYTERGILTTNTNLYAIATGLTGSVTINSIRRVLDSGQTHPGEGTILCGVYLPWSSSAVPNDTNIVVWTGFNSTTGSRFAIRRNSSGIFSPVYMSDGIAGAQSPSMEINAGYYLLVSQWSAALGKMRVGLYNPTTKILTWYSPTLAGGITYRGFFPIFGTGSQQRLRWGYGLGNLPIWIGPCAWFNSILTDDQIRWMIGELDTASIDSADEWRMAA